MDRQFTLEVLAAILMNGCWGLFQAVFGHEKSPLTKSKKKQSQRVQQYKTHARQGTDWLSASMQNGRGKVESLGFKPESPESLLPALSTKPFILINCFKKIVYDLLYVATCKQLFAVQDYCLGYFNLNIKARQKIREFLNANL